MSSKKKVKLIWIEEPFCEHCGPDLMPFYPTAPVDGTRWCIDCLGADQMLTVAEQEAAYDKWWKAFGIPYEALMHGFRKVAEKL